MPKPCTCIRCKMSETLPMRKPTNLNAYMLHHKPYEETWYDYFLAVLIALVFASLMFSYFDFSLFGG